MLYLDTYALLGILDGSPAYRRLVGQEAVTHDANLLETAAQLLRRGDRSPWTRLDNMGVGNISHDRVDLVAAAALKVAPELRSRNLSYIDVLGYSIALRMGHAFVTGDRGFEGLPRVEFVVAR